ncbi:acyltransferase family protein [Fimbriimonas ginsengisoli Gsoil 348]|uniref:Acyltransferase family protein n=2 Tax=Fimbriimonas ginsengisoli TaxID=1005039 RepID=A0A068NTS9_FIMGI|nr:acyltransferase family protein [Fimbriimonas ginsengisoli Gsoil 348]
MVFLHHAPIVALDAVEKGGGFGLRMLLAVRHAGAFGVPLFFALSGFLITSLLLIERERTGTVDVRAFYIRRILRIWPAYYLALILFLWMRWAAGDGLPLDAGLRYALLLGNYVAPYWGISVLWSISVEEQFYALWPLAAKRLAQQGLCWIAIGLVFVGLAFRAALIFVDGATWETAWYSTPAQVDCVGLGALLALYRDRLPRLAATRLQIWGWLIACLCGLIAASSLCPPLGVDPSWLSWTTRLFGTGFAALMVWILVTKPPEVHVLEGRLWVGLGKISYGMYLIHLLVMPLAVWVSDRLHLGLFGATGLSLALTIALAAALYRFYEMPFLRLKAHFARVQSRP